jgi:hypothetical protein
MKRKVYCTGCRWCSRNLASDYMVYDCLCPSVGKVRDHRWSPNKTMAPIYFERWPETEEANKKLDCKHYKKKPSWMFWRG